MAESLEKAVVRNLQKEQERERRRIRDREKRQSMTAEEREKHLARRRKNYQLRRQRAAIANTNSNLAAATAAATTTTMLVLPSHQHHSIISTQDGGVQPRECSYTSQEKSSDGLEIPPHVSCKLPQRSRLNYIKHLARSVNDPVDVDSKAQVQVQVASGLYTEEVATPSGLQQKGLRLNHVKQLARGMTSQAVPSEWQGKAYVATES